MAKKEVKEEPQISTKPAADTLPDQISIKLGYAFMWGIPQYDDFNKPSNPIGADRGIILTKSEPGPITLDTTKLNETQRNMIKIGLARQEILDADSDVMVPKTQAEIGLMVDKHDHEQLRKEIENLIRERNYVVVCGLLRTELDKKETQNKAAIAFFRNALKHLSDDPVILKNPSELAKFKEARIQAEIKFTPQFIRPKSDMRPAKKETQKVMSAKV